MASEAGKVRLRDRREPGHFWADNEIIDVFGDELGQNGISVYMTMTRFCYGVEVKLSLREIAAAARMSKDTVARSMKVLVALGLVIESKGPKAKTVSSWSLASVKALVKDFVRSSASRGFADGSQQSETVSGSDRLKPLQARESASHGATSTLVQLVNEQRGNCLTVRQNDSSGESVDKKICAEHAATDLSQTEGDFETDLSQNGGSYLYSKTQDTKLQDTTPLPPASQGDAARMAKMPAAEDKNENALDDGVRKVMRELNLTERRMAAVIRDAIEGYRSKFDDTPSWDSVAERMVKARQNYLSFDEQLRYQVGVRKFFAQGIWLDKRQWVLDKDELGRQRRSEEAMVGVDPGLGAKAVVDFDVKPDDEFTVGNTLWLYRGTKQSSPEYWEGAPKWVREELGEDSLGANFE